jgi:hypothetical protein
MTELILDNLMETFVAAQRTAALLDADFPPDVMLKKWMAAKHSPTPWTVVHAHYMSEETCEAALLDALLVRAELAVAIEKLNACIVGIKAEDRPIDLTLAKVRRTA